MVDAGISLLDIKFILRRRKEGRSIAQTTMRIHFHLYVRRNFSIIKEIFSEFYSLWENESLYPFEVHLPSFNGCESDYTTILTVILLIYTFTQTLDTPLLIQKKCMNGNYSNSTISLQLCMFIITMISDLSTMTLMFSFWSFKKFFENIREE